MSDRDYEVGHGKPPKSGQFKPNQSGNPNGRPKGSKNFKTDVRDTLSMLVPVTSSGKRATVTTQKAALMRLREKALKGDQRAMDRLLALAQVYNGDDLARDTQADVTAADKAIMQRFAARDSHGHEQ